jgi:hypothetical protein
MMNAIIAHLAANDCSVTHSSWVRRRNLEFVLRARFAPLALLFYNTLTQPIGLSLRMQQT